MDMNREIDEILSRVVGFHTSWAVGVEVPIPPTLEAGFGHRVLIVFHSIHCIIFYSLYSFLFIVFFSIHCLLFYSLYSISLFHSLNDGVSDSVRGSERFEVYCVCSTYSTSFTSGTTNDNESALVHKSNNIEIQTISTTMSTVSFLLNNKNMV